MSQAPAVTKIGSLEAARFVAAALVVFHHATLIPMEARFLGHAPLDGVFFPGHMGVEFFFVLSGFIIMHAHRNDLGRTDKLGSYLWRRISRIYFPYWAVLAVLIPAYLFTGMGTPDKRDPGYLAASVLLLPQSVQPVLGVAWTLMHEVVFYALFGLFILNRRLVAPVLLGWVALILVNQFVWNLPYPGSFLLSLYNTLFAIGVGCALLVGRRRIPGPGLVLGAGLLLVAGGWAAELSWPLPWEGLRALYGAASAMILLGLVELERSGRLRVPGWCVALGAASYAIYLVHVVVQSFVLNAWFRTTVTQSMPEWALFAALVALPLIGGLIFHRLVERPMLRLTRRSSPPLKPTFSNRASAGMAV